MRWCFWTPVPAMPPSPSPRAAVRWCTSGPGQGISRRPAMSTKIRILTRLNTKSGQNGTISSKMGLRPCLKYQNGPYGWCRVTPSGVLDGIGRKTPPCNHSRSVWSISFGLKSGRLIPTLATVCFHPLPPKKNSEKCVMTMAAAETAPLR